MKRLPVFAGSLFFWPRTVGVILKMRGWIVLVGAAAALAGCGNGNQADDSQDLNQSLTARNIVANDVTAIDAVTGDAANMAEDVDFTEALNELGPADGNTSGGASRPRRQAGQTTPAPARREPRTTAPAPAPATEPITNEAD